MTVAQAKALRKPYVRPDMIGRQFCWRHFNGHAEFTSTDRFATMQEATAAAESVADFFETDCIVIVPEGDPMWADWKANGQYTIPADAFQHVEPWMGRGRQQYEPGYAEARQL